MTYSLPRAYAVFSSRFIIAVNGDDLYAQKQGKLASVCLQRFSSIFETSIQLWINLLSLYNMHEL